MSLQACHCVQSLYPCLSFGFSFLVELWHADGLVTVVTTVSLAVCSFGVAWCVLCGGFFAGDVLLCESGVLENEQINFQRETLQKRSNTPFGEYKYR